MQPNLPFSVNIREQMKLRSCVALSTRIEGQQLAEPFLLTTRHTGRQKSFSLLDYFLAKIKIGTDNSKNNER